MSNEILLNADLREDMGKGASRRLRHAGMVPAIVYGGKNEPVAITLEQREIQKEIKHEGFYSQLIHINLKNVNKKQMVILKDIQRHPYKPLVTHLDFERVSTDKAITVHIPIHYINEDTAIGVKQGGGVISHHITDVEITCLPKDLPEFLTVDLANLELDKTLHLSDLELPKEVKSVALSHEDNKAVVSIHLPKAAPIEDEETTVETSETEDAEKTSASSESDDAVEEKTEDKKD